MYGSEARESYLERRSLVRQVCAWLTATYYLMRRNNLDSGRAHFLFDVCSPEQQGSLIDAAREYFDGMTHPDDLVGWVEDL